MLHRERFASAWSHRSLITRLGGAQNALGVTLTDTELWLKTPTAFWGIVAFYDLLHRIDVQDIARVEDAGNTIFIHFTRSDSSPAKVQLKLRDKSGFLSKVEPLLSASNKKTAT